MRMTADGERADLEEAAAGGGECEHAFDLVRKSAVCGGGGLLIDSR